MQLFTDAGFETSHEYDRMAFGSWYTELSSVEVEAFEYEDPIDFSHEELVAYLMSQSNTIAPVTEGRETPDETADWLRNETVHWFHPPLRRTFLFRGAARCLKRQC